MDAVLCALARVDTSVPVLDFNDCFSRRVLEEAKGTMTCFVTPNLYSSFTELLKEYHNRGNDLFLFYPTLETKDPVIPDFLGKNTRFLHLREL